MNDLNDDVSYVTVVDAVLVGGPDDLPEAARRTRARDGDTIKVVHRGGYEHFDCDDRPQEQEGHGPRVFRWTMRTRIAE
jgi:hypothetical protein